MIFDLNELPAVAAYLRRIDAKPVNFKSARISVERNGYPKPIGWVKFSPLGIVTASGAAEPPTAAEADAIANEFATADFPKPVTLTAIADPPPDCDLHDFNTFICHDFDGQIVMVHQRYETKSGKGFLPWTRWSDGVWRKMEPETLPFYGLPGASDSSILYIHEGAKSARKVREIIAGELPATRFPWVENMRWGHHIGWIGGIHDLDRSDWESLARMSWSQVIIVADNDPGGVAVVPKIAKHFRCPTFSLQFTREWEPKFDLGDDFPDSMFSPVGHYTGPPYEYCIQPATWATDERVIPADTPRGRDRVVPVIRDVFAEQWAWIEKVDQMVHIEMPQYRIPTARFDKFIRAFSDAPETSKVFFKHYSGNQMSLAYDPSNEGRIIRNEQGLQAVNLYQPPSVRPIPGDFGPWIEFMEYLIPKSDDRAAVMRWIATLAAKPGTRMIYGMLLMSERQGIGKGTLGRILAELVGRHNTAFPGESMITNSEFNGWIEGKRLIVVDEIYSGHSWKAYNRLKPYVADETIEVNVKHQATWSMINWTHYLLMSNSRAALKLEATDRRLLVPEVSEVAWSEGKFMEFNEWLKQGGFAHIAYWAATFAERGEGTYVRPGETAPASANKSRLIEESRSEAEQLILQLAETLRENSAPVAVLVPAIKTWVSEQMDERVYETTQAIGRILVKAGLTFTKQIKIGGIKQAAISNRAEMADWEPERIREALKAPKDMIGDVF